MATSNLNDWRSGFMPRNGLNFAQDYTSPLAGSALLPIEPAYTPPVKQFSLSRTLPWQGGLMGTMGDQAGDYAIPKMAPVPGWTSETMPGLQPDTGFLSGWGSAITDKLKAGNQWAQDVGLLGGKDANGNAWSGWGSLALNGITAGLGAYTNMKKLGLMEDSLEFEKKKFAADFENQRKLTNAQLEGRQRARIASNAGAYESLDSYMKKYAV